MNTTLHFALTPDDYHEFMLAFYRHRKSMRPPGSKASATMVFWSVWFLYLVGLYLLATFLLPSSPEALPPLPSPPAPRAGSLGEALWNLAVALGSLGLFLGRYAAMFIVSMFFLLWLLRSRMMHRRGFEEMPKLALPQEVQLADAGMTARQTGCLRTMDWSFFVRMAEMKHVFVLFLDARRAEILPKRSFASEDEMNAFRAFANAHIEKPAEASAQS